MRAVRELRPPGVYPAVDEPRAKPLTVVETGIAGFVGLAARGPLDEPVRLGGWNEFVEVFGASNDSYLARAVEGFFANGGGSCYVVRVARRPRPGELLQIEHAARAEWIVKDGWNKPTLRVCAKNEGRWGNNIWVRFQQGTAARTLLTLDLEIAAGEAQVNSTKGFARGALVHIYDRENSDFVVLTEVEDRLLRWGSVTPTVHGYRAAGPTYLEVLEFELFASSKDRREVFRGLQLSPLSRRYAPRIVTDESSLVQLFDLGSPVPLPHHLPQAGPATRLAGGRDGNVQLSAADFIGHDQGPGQRTGLMALGAIEEVALLSVPDVMGTYQQLPAPQADREVQLVQDAMISLCEGLQDRVALLDAPPTKELDELRKWKRRLNSSYAAFYYPWIMVERTGGAPVLCPPSGHVAGVIARCDEREGVFKAPANEVMAGAVGLMLNLSEDHLGLLNSDGINVVRSLPGRGIRIWGARTTSDDSDWRHLNVRRLFIMLRRAIGEGTQWVVFEPNAPSTWERLAQSLDEFLKGLWEDGYFAGNTPAESYFVRCDAATNPPEARIAGQLTAEIGVAPAIPAEYIIFNVVQKMSDHTSQAE